LNGIQDSAKKLMNLYEDKDGTRREEITQIQGQGPNLFSVFYDRLRDIKEYHKKYPESDITDRPEERLYFDEEQGKLVCCLDINV
jgi:splicing factor 3A subunit 3